MSIPMQVHYLNGIYNIHQLSNETMTHNSRFLADDVFSATLLKKIGAPW